MTKDELSKLTPGEKRVRIAEITGKSKDWVVLKRGMYWRPNDCGYTYREDEAGAYTETEALRRCHSTDNEVTCRLKTPPDYLNDLNAMHEAEKTLSVKDAVFYGARLRGFAVDSTEWDTAALAFEWHATAAQRAEAFLLTIG